LSTAVGNARADAEALARAAGGSLGQLLELSTNEFPIRPMQEMAMGRVAMAQAKTPIEAGQQTVMATVSTKWVFVPAK